MVALFIFIKVCAQPHQPLTFNRKNDAKESTSPAKDATGTTKGKEIEVKLLVAGDIIFLSAGDMIPADVRLIEAKDLFLSQSTLTGESLPAEKHVDLGDRNEKKPLELVNLCFIPPYP